ncbi:MAG: ABC exporter membrane fusion protein [Fischerella sp. CENA71]|nr:ABC exporter membrane fusion protein [Fischerella sp. CENA71]
MTQQFLSKPSTQKLIGLVITATALTSAIAFYGISQYGLVGNSEPPAVETPPVVKKVTALGRLQPEGEVISLSAPLALDGDRLAKWFVKESDRVKTGQILAILDSQKHLQDAVVQAKEQVKIAQAKLAQVQAGAKTGEIQAQQANINRIQTEQLTEIQAQTATIARLRAEQQTETQAQQANIGRLTAELANAKLEFQRHQTLYQQGAISASSLDSKRLTFQTTQQQLAEAQANLQRIQTSRQQELAEAQANLRRIQTSRQQELKSAKATLNQIAEVRPVDLQAAQAEVDNAIATLKQAQTNLEQAYIRAPFSGQILKIHTHAGEKIADAGIAELGQTNQMLVVAEVYQTDIGKIQLGQQAVISGQAFSGELRGKVSHIGLQVNKQNVFSNEPGENLDRRVVEVKIRLNLEDSKRVGSLTNLQVQTAIEL